MSSDRGVSHSVGFVLTFGIIIVSAGIVSTVGFNQLDDMRSSEQQQNAERAMTLLHQNVGELQRGTSVRRSGEIDLNQGSLRYLYDGDSTINVEITNVPSSSTTDDFEASFDMSGVVYERGSTDIVYEGGALLRQDPSGTSLVTGPSFVCTDDRAIVSLITVHTDSYRQVSSGTVSTNLAYNSSSTHFPINRTGENSTDGRSTVTVDIASEYADGWDRYFERDDNGWESNGGAHTFVCAGEDEDGDGVRDGVDQYTVVRTVVDVEVVR